jgi:hypothetical protein
MYLQKATHTICNKVLFVIAAGMAAELQVVYLQVVHTAASLAAPAVALENLTV